MVHLSGLWTRVHRRQKWTVDWTGSWVAGCVSIVDITWCFWDYVKQPYLRIGCIFWDILMSMLAFISGITILIVDNSTINMVIPLINVNMEIRCKVDSKMDIVICPKTGPCHQNTYCSMGVWTMEFLLMRWFFVAFLTFNLCVHVSV